MTELHDLKPSQRSVARLVAEGRTDKQIAAVIGVSVSMVRLHIEALAFLIDADRSLNIRVQITSWWVRHANEPERAA